MKVLQIYNHVPDMLKPCIDSVKAFADRTNSAYIVHGEAPNTFRYKSVWADYIRIQYASLHTNLWYFDWDIKLNDDFGYNGIEPAFYHQTPEACFYTGNDLSLFKKWRKDFEKIADEKGKMRIKQGQLFWVMKPDLKDGIKYVDASKLEHLVYHKFNPNMEVQNVSKDK